MPAGRPCRDRRRRAVLDVVGVRDDAQHAANASSGKGEQGRLRDPSVIRAVWQPAGPGSAGAGRERREPGRAHDRDQRRRRPCRARSSAAPGGRPGAPAGRARRPPSRRRPPRPRASGVGQGCVQDVEQDAGAARHRPRRRPSAAPRRDGRDDQVVRQQLAAPRPSRRPGPRRRAVPHRCRPGRQRPRVGGPPRRRPPSRPRPATPRPTAPWPRRRARATVGADDGDAPRSASAATMPGTSVFAADPPAVPQHQGVGGPRGARGRVGLVEPAPATAAFSGMVSDSPAQSGPRLATNAGEVPPRRTRRVVAPVQPEVGVRGPVQDRRQRVRDRRSEDRRPHPPFAFSSALNCRNSAYELVNLVSPVFGSTVTQYSQLPAAGVEHGVDRVLAGRVDRAGRQAGVQVGVVRRRRRDVVGGQRPPCRSSARS